MLAAQYSEFQPNWASAPGDTIVDILTERNISITTLAENINVRAEQIQELIKGTIIINDEIANGLSKVLGSSSSFWLKREEQFRAAVERIKKKEVSWLQKLPIADMQQWGLISRSEDLLKECLKFFGVVNVSNWEFIYGDVLNRTAFRTSTAYESNPFSTIVWLRVGEIQASEIATDSFDRDKLMASLPALRECTKIKSPKDFIPKVRNILQQCGVAFAVSKTPQKCVASGAAMFIDGEKAMLLVSFRYLTDDHFWFTFFHELGHLVLHGNKKCFIDIDAEYLNSAEETEANEFSEEILIPQQIRTLYKSSRIDKKKIIQIAKEADISLGIVVGQLQKQKLIPLSYFNGFKRRYSWTDINH
jgi:HTH-type transcriptional regulator/antitoxin HigA